LKRSITDVLRRGFDNAVANWPLVLIRVVETALLVAMCIGAAVAIVIPLVISANVGGGWDQVQKNPDAILTAVLNILTAHWLLIVYLLLIASAVLTIAMAIHAAVEAGSARVYLDAERAGSISRTETRERFEVFAMETFLAGAREGWWRVFWIYNIAWLASGLVLLVPLAAGAALIALIGMNAAALVVGCLILLAMCLLLFVVALFTNLWVQKAIVLALGRGLSANAALRAGRHQIGGDFTRHAALTVIMVCISLAGTAFLSSFSSGGFPVHGNSINWQLLTASPLAVGSSILNTAFSAAVASWFLACIAAIQQENPA
jgi:hypothetical protein